MPRGFLLFLIVPYIGVILIVSSSDDHKWETKLKKKRRFKRSQGNKADWRMWGSSKILYHHVSNFSGSTYHITRMFFLASGQLQDSRQKEESKEFLRRIWNQPFLSTGRSTQQSLFSCSALKAGENGEMCPREGVVLMEMMWSIIITPGWEAGSRSAKPSCLLGSCSVSVSCVISLLHWVKCPSN